MKVEDYPEIIYKYRNWTGEFNKNVLLKNQLYLSAPKDFNDPFDCRILENWSLLNTPEKIAEYVDGVLNRHMKKLIAEGYDIDAERKRITEKVSDHKTIQKEEEELLFKQQDIRYGILSLSARWDSILMWSHYADFHKGYCIGFFEEKMRNSELFGKGGPVSYSTKFPEISPLETNIEAKSFLETHSKANDWDYEKEYRLMKLFYPNPPSDKDRIVTITDDCISEVIIGLCTPEDHKKEIVDLCKKRGIRVFTTYKVPFEFKIERVEI
jgi:hypothetical protein